MRKLSIAEPVTALRHVPIVDNGEPLVDFLDACPDLLMDAARFDYRRETMVRESVARMLCEANRTLMSQGYRLAIVEGWRPLHIQKRMHLGILKRFRDRFPDWSDTKLKRKANQYTAPLHGKVPPPHSTGGAVDLQLCDMDGFIQDHVSPYEPYDPACFHFAAKGLSDTALANRQRLWNALVPTGITNYPSEYWHWTYGDQGWAYRGEHANAVYGSIEPKNYRPDPKDVIEEPLILKKIDLGRRAMTVSEFRSLAEGS